MGLKRNQAVEQINHLGMPSRISLKDLHHLLIHTFQSSLLKMVEEGTLNLAIL